MNAEMNSGTIVPTLTKAAPNSAVLVAVGDAAIAIKAGTRFAGVIFAEQTDVTLPVLTPGTDYAVVVSAEGKPGAAALSALPLGSDVLGGFHFAPGGNAPARAGGDEVPAINRFSLWDVAFRPACRDPRGMALVEGPHGKFWCDIYLTGIDHKQRGTSAFGQTIADGDNVPKGLRRFDYASAQSLLDEHGKQVLSVEEFFAAAYGVTERSSCGKDPMKTGLDAPRTSKFGIMQATGNMWTWGHDGDPDEPRAALFAGAWGNAADSGSRASAWSDAPPASTSVIGARGRCDHLQPA